jgi:hypothetical protein
MHADNRSSKAISLLLIIFCASSTTVPMERKNFEFLTTYASLKKNYNKTKDFLYTCNHKIATAGIITFSVGCGCGGGFLAFLLLKSYAAAALLGTLTSPVAYGFQKLSKKIDELRKTIQDNHGEIKTLMAQGDEKVIGELKEHFTQQLELALEEIKKSNESSQDQTRKSLEHNIAHALEAIKLETDKQYNYLTTSLAEIKHENKLILSSQDFFKREIEEEKKIKQQAIKQERNTLLAEIKQIGTVYFACDADQVEEFLEADEKVILDEQSNKQLLQVYNKLRFGLLQKQHDGLLDLVLENGKQLSTLKQEFKDTLSKVVSRLDKIEQAQQSQGNQLTNLENFASNQTVHTAELRKGMTQILTIVDPKSNQASSNTSTQPRSRLLDGLPNQFGINPLAPKPNNLTTRALPYHGKK